MGAKNLKKGEILFNEGDPSDAMFVIKSGKIAITKSKGSSDIILAELGPGDMLGEMAFFDNRPRSAGAKALADAVIVELPFAALNAQFRTFPEWLKAIVRTVNNHLRNANIKIKNLERSAEEDTQIFPPHMITRLMGVLGLVTARYGEKEKAGTGIVVPAGVLRRYTIQVFQLPTNKLQTLMEVLQNFGYMTMEDLGEGRQKLTVLKLDQIIDFVDFYNDWIFKPEEKRTTIDAKEIPALKALLHYGRKETPNAKGEVKVNLTEMQSTSIAQTGGPFSVDDVNSLVEKKITTEKMSIDNGIALSFVLKDLEQSTPHWELIHILTKMSR